MDVLLTKSGRPKGGESSFSQMGPFTFIPFEPFNFCFRIVHFHVLNRPDSVDLDRPLLFLADRLHSFFGQSRLGPSTFTSDHFDKNAKHDLYFRRINKQKQKVMAKEARLNASLNNVRVEEESDSDEDPEGKDHPLLIIGKKTRRLDISVPVM